MLVSLLTIKRLILAILLSMLLVPVSRADQDMLLVLSSDTAIYNNFYTSLQTRLKNNNLQVAYANEITKELLNKYKIVITAGKDATIEITRHNTTSTIIYSLVTMDFFNNSDLVNGCAGSACYGVYIDQPLQRYIKLVDALFDDSYSIAVPLSENSRYSKNVISSGLRQFGLKPNIFNINREENISRQLQNNLARHSVLLALPDTDIYNSNTAKSVLLTTYHLNVPIVAYSKAFSKAGALASLYSSIDDIADKTAQISVAITQGTPPVQAGYHPENYSLEINTAVARSLSIHIPEMSAIKRKIK